MKLGELKIVKQKEDSKMTKQFGQEIAFDQVTCNNYSYASISPLCFIINHLVRRERQST